MKNILKQTLAILMATALAATGRIELSALNGGVIETTYGNIGNIADGAYHRIGLTASRGSWGDPNKLFYKIEVDGNTIATSNGQNHLWSTRMNSDVNFTKGYFSIYSKGNYNLSLRPVAAKRESFSAGSYGVRVRFLGDPQATAQQAIYYIKPDGSHEVIAYLPVFTDSKIHWETYNFNAPAAFDRIIVKKTGSSGKTAAIDNITIITNN